MKLGIITLLALGCGGGVTPPLTAGEGARIGDYQRGLDTCQAVGRVASVVGDAGDAGDAASGSYAAYAACVKEAGL